MGPVSNSTSDLSKHPQYMQKPKAVLFDWDNTIADTWPVIYESLHKTFIAMGHEPWSFEDVKGGRQNIHHSVRDSFPKIFGDRWEEARQHYYTAFLDCHIEKIVPLPDIAELLEMLAETDIYMAVVSNKTGPYLRREAEHLGFDKHFDKVVGATDAESDKPTAAPVYMALEGSGIEAEDGVWFIGDSTTDIECALNSGCMPVYFGSHPFPEHYHSDERLDYKIPHFKTHDELKKFFGGIL